MPEVVMVPPFPEMSREQMTEILRMISSILVDAEGREKYYSLHSIEAIFEGAAQEIDDAMRRGYSSQAIYEVFAENNNTLRAGLMRRLNRRRDIEVIELSIQDVRDCLSDYWPDGK